jgi:hypothetical protein
MSKKRNKKRPPKRTLALPDLEQSKAAVLNTLTLKSGQRSYDRAITDFVDWYCSEPRLAFTARWFCGTGFISNRSSTLPRQSISVWLQFVASPMKRPIPVSSARSWLPEFDE